MSEMTKTFSFAELIRQYKIEIPIIQRDYAQGRDNPKAESIREAFVSDLISALVQDKSRESNKLELAFIYGRVENGVFVPVDGQQRLTTLYLLHLYLVKCCLTVQSSCDWCPHGNPLARFTYATRQSSREFCETIVSPGKQVIPIPPDDNLRKFVEDQPWFVAEWKFDPTISGMLEVLKVIHTKFKVSAIEGNRYAELLSCLYGDKCPIRFHFLDMGHHGLTDDLYLKMNARGLPLTALENIKCSLEKYCDDCGGKENKQSRITPEQVTFINIEKGEEKPFAGTFSVGKRISTLCDHAWLDFFWRVESGSTENDVSLPAKCNASMMVVIARLVALYAFERDTFPEEEPKDGKERKEYEKCLKYKTQIDDKLLNISGNEEFIPFELFKEVFEWGNASHTRSADVIGYIANRLNRMTLYKDEMVAGLLPYWAGDEGKNATKNATWSAFFGELKSGKAWKQYAALHAVLSFMDYMTQWDKDEFSKWMRVQWNIIENGAVDSFEQMQRYVRLCVELTDAAKGTSILASLAARLDPGRIFTTQMEEEISKAKLIVHDNIDKANWTAIEAAEKLPWFRGRISAILNGDIVDQKLKGWFSEESMGMGGSDCRKKWVRRIICHIEQDYSETNKEKPWVYLPVSSIVGADSALKDAIYDKGAGPKIKAAVDCSANYANWINRMGGEDEWYKIKCLSSYRGNDVYAYTTSDIRSAIRIDEKIDWWYDFVKCIGADSCYWNTRDRGIWVLCRKGDYDYALCQDGEDSFIQISPRGKGDWIPSNEEAKKIFKEWKKQSTACVPLPWSALLTMVENAARQLDCETPPNSGISL